tara:strand:- start:1024 stop:1320 length:297 start_codon:yes stop_codon:yes gene_type:complete
MKIVINEQAFVDAFMKFRPNQFTYEGLTALFEHLEEFEDATGEEIELDVIGLCCEYCEYDNLKEFQDEYGKEYETIEDIENETIVIPINEESFIISVF